MGKTTTLDRRFLIDKLKLLLSDEFDTAELVYENESTLIMRIIYAAEYYMDQYNEINS